MSQGIIDELEPVEVEVEHRQCALVALRLRQGLV
jgi:hypothetical protein